MPATKPAPATRPPPATRPTKAATTSRRKPRGQGFERKPEIMTAARELFLKHGVANTSIRKIASRVGLSSTSIYVYFKDKDDLVLQLCAETFARLLAQFEAVPVDPQNPLARLRQMTRTYYDFALAHPDEYRLTYFVEHPRLPEVLPREIPSKDSPFYHGVAAFHVLVCELQSLTSGHHITCTDPYLTAQVLWANVHGLVSAQLAMPDFPWHGAEQLLDEMARITLQGLLASDDTGTLPTIT